MKNVVLTYEQAIQIHDALRSGIIALDVAGTGEIVSRQLCEVREELTGPIRVSQQPRKITTHINAAGMLIGRREGTP